MMIIDCIYDNLYMSMYCTCAYTYIMCCTVYIVFKKSDRRVFLGSEWEVHRHLQKRCKDSGADNLFPDALSIQSKDLSARFLSNIW